ncbi:MAG: hypothetical protein K1X94_26425 [Sandaracinaceae bacterium]|nr:hypothetical protein [Sandaracinaceae bacterium]
MGRPKDLVLLLAVVVVGLAPSLSPSTARADGPLFRFSANVLPLDVVGGGAADYAMIGGGASLGLDLSAIDILDVGLRARFVVAPLFSSPRVYGTGWYGGLALAARLHAPLVAGEVSWSLGLEVGGVGGQFGVRGDAAMAMGVVSILLQPGLEHVVTSRFAMTYGLELGVMVSPPNATLHGALLVGIRAG